MVNSRAKGCRGERSWRDVLRSIGFTDARRGQQFSGSPDSPDVVNGIPGTHPEVKWVEKLNIYTAIEQAVADAGDAIPYVACKRNRKPWLVVVRADDLVDFSRRVAAATDRTEGAAQ